MVDGVQPTQDAAFQVLQRLMTVDYCRTDPRNRPSLGISPHMDHSLGVGERDLQYEACSFVKFVKNNSTASSLSEIATVTT